MFILFWSMWIESKLNAEFMLYFRDSCNLIQSVKSYQKWDVFLKYFCYYLSRYSILKVTLNKGSLCINQKSLKFDLPLSENGTKNYCYIAGKWTGNRTFHTNQGYSVQVVWWKAVSFIVGERIQTVLLVICLKKTKGVTLFYRRSLL